MGGRTWLLLPEGFRDEVSASTYPVPSSISELQTLISIPLPGRKRDGGCAYLRRIAKLLKAKRQKKLLAPRLSAESRLQQIEHAYENQQKLLKRLRVEARDEVSRVRDAADKAIASLSDLFDLGRNGLDGQMQAHMAGEEWRGERITADAFRQCFRLVSQAVKGLGLPTAQRESAGEAIMSQVAASIRATQDGLDGDIGKIADEPEGDLTN